eukprot:gi/632990868/ref/XP_007884367.1/ PREDICTED: UDP-GlcNAc:betaGal beta-1,3-N-acetylglucosaminyltransferase 2-like [Callorhinchus milii]
MKLSCGLRKTCVLLGGILLLLVIRWGWHRTESLGDECQANAFWNVEQRQMEREGERRPEGTGERASSCRGDPSVAQNVVGFCSFPQQMRDFLLYRRCRAFPVLMEPSESCRHRPSLLLVIKSRPPHFENRQAIRQSWGGLRKTGDVTLGRVFLLGEQGKADHYPDLSRLLAVEQREFGDLLQWGFRDTFFNLTLKEILFQRWLAERCPGPRYIFKGDDDVFVNTDRMLDYVLGLGRRQRRNLFVGDTILDALPSRDLRQKYYIPRAFYAGSYPPYAGGAGVLFSADLARRLLWVSAQVPLFPIDDVYVGMCLSRLGVAPQRHEGFRSFGIAERNKWDVCTYRQLLVVHRRTPHEMIRLWISIRQHNRTCPP